MPRSSDRRSARAGEYRRWYWTARWRMIAKAQLEAEPLCFRCLEAGSVTPATVCHHETPHRGDPEKFWNGPFRSVCAPCHDGALQQEEKRGYRPGVDADGRPSDPSHPWNRTAKR